MRKSVDLSLVKETEVLDRLSDNLIQYFYIFGIEPDCLDILELTEDKKFLEPNYKNVKLLSKYPPFDQYQSNINPNTLMSHCFPEGYSLIESEQQPEDEFFHFNLDNLFALYPENKNLYFFCEIIYEPIKSYLNIKYDKKIPELKQSELITEENIKNMVSLEKIFIPKALCFSSFVCFPHEMKILINELINYIRNNHITLPIEKLMETIVFGIPRPLKAHFYISINKKKLIPGQTKDIDFMLREFNQYNFSSYPFQSIFKFTTTSILSIYKGLLLEIPILFFSKNKELLTNIIESFLSLLYPLEYQYPHISVLPDSHCGLIETEKCFVFGINRELQIEIKVGENGEKNRYAKYFQNMNLNVANKPIILANIDGGKVMAYSEENGTLHVVNFENLGVYNDSNVVDPNQIISKNIYSGAFKDITNLQLPQKYTEKLKNKLDSYKKDNKNISENFSTNNNKKIGEDYFYYYLASILLYFNNYLFNGEQEIKKIYKEILVKREEEINIENLFMVNQFLHDFKYDINFYSRFFKTKLFKNFLIRKYLNGPLERYIFLHFDEKILEKKGKSSLFKRYNLKFILSKLFQSTIPYTVKEPTNFSEEEFSEVKSKKNILLNKYYQNIDDNNIIKYVIFPKLIYDSKFFEKEYKPSISFYENSELKNLIKSYQSIENSLKYGLYSDFFSIYNGDIISKYLINNNKMEYNNEVLNSLYFVWVLVFCMTFYYCDEIEKHFRFEELMRFLPKIIDPNEELIRLLLITIRKYGDDNMMIKIYELIKKLNYGEYAILCSKFKSDVKLNWDLKHIDVANSKLTISYFRDPKIDDKNLSEVKTVNYDIKSLKKRTFFSNEQYNNSSDNEKISLDISFQCPFCKEKFYISSVVVNLGSKMKNSFMTCEKCKNIMEPISHVVFGNKKEAIIIYSPIRLLEIAREIMKEWGPNINMDKLRTKYNTFFWNCIIYFNYNNLSFEMLLKYKNIKSSEVPVKKKRRKAFKILEIEKQNNEAKII